MSLRIGAHAKRALATLERLTGCRISIERSAIRYRLSSTNLNIGCGKKPIQGFRNLDLDTDYYHGAGGIAFTKYDMRRDCIPCPSNSVDNIYCSHVIEHIESEHVVRFVEESLRVLRAGGILRIACPDAQFLWEVSSFDNDYWAWRESWFERQASPGQLPSTPGPKDFYLREIATPRSPYYQYQLVGLTIEPDHPVWHKDYENASASLVKPLQYRVDHPGDHISYWDYDRLFAAGKAAGFSRVIRSKPGGSVSRAMQGSDIDQTHPNMSLYVDLVK